MRSSGQFLNETNIMLTLNPSPFHIGSQIKFRVKFCHFLENDFTSLVYCLKLGTFSFVFVTPNKEENICLKVHTEE